MTELAASETVDSQEVLNRCRIRPKHREWNELEIRFERDRIASILDALSNETEPK